MQAAAILHDIAIKYCKDNYDGDASQERQKKEMPHLVNSFLQAANYLPSYIPRILELVEKHHDYDAPKDRTLQILMEADLIINCYENHPGSEKIKYIKDILLYKATNTTQLYSEEERSKIKEISEIVEKERLINLVYELSSIENEMKFSTQKNILFQAGIIKL